MDLLPLLSAGTAKVVELGATTRTFGNKGRRHWYQPSTTATIS